MARTMTRRPTVAIPGAISSRAARPTIQLPDQSASVAASTSQAVKRMTADYRLRAKLGSHATGQRGRPLARIRVDRRCKERQARSEEHTSELQSPYDLVCR